MGNKQDLPIEVDINKELKKQKINIIEEEEENELFQICYPHFYNNQEIILKNSIKYILQLSNPLIYEILFKIFGRGEGKNTYMEYEDLKYLYFAFKSQNPKIKAILFSYLLLQNKKSLDYDNYSKNIFQIFLKDFPMQIYLSNKINELNDINKANNKSNMGFYTKEDFINNFGQDENFYNTFQIIKKIIGSSKYKFNLDKNEKLNYICDCAYSPYNKSTENQLDLMKQAYNSITSETKNLLYFKDFQKSLEKEKIHKNLINLAIDYLGKYTQRDYCCFNDIKYIFTNLNYSLSLNDKIKFLFKMILTIYSNGKNDNKLTYKQIENYLNTVDDTNINEINSNENSKTYNEEDFINNKIFEQLIKNLNPHLEKFGLIPYSVFKLKVTDNKIKRRLIKEILKNENIDNYEKYLEDKFTEYDYFYAVDINFWNQLMNENEELPDYLSNSKLADEIIKEEDILNKEIKKLLMNQNKKERKEKGDKKEKVIKDNKKEEKGNINKNNEKEKNNNIKKSDEKGVKDKNNIEKISKKEELNKQNEDNKKNGDNIKENNKDKINKDNIKIDINEAQVITTKIGNLKKELKYKKDFILLCGEIYQLIKTNFQMDYIIKLTKNKTIIDLNKTIKNEEPKKEENKENEQKREGEGEATKENINEKKEQKDNKENDADYTNKEQLVKEKLDKFIFDEERGLISKIVKENTENKYILNELYFNPIQVYQNSFGALIRLIEKTKIMYDELEKTLKNLKLPQKEQNQIKKKEEKKTNAFSKKKQKYLGEKEDLDMNRAKGVISQNDYEIKLKELNIKYEDIFTKKEKNENDYIVDITLEEFKIYLLKYKNDLLLDKKSNIYLYPRSTTLKDIKNNIISKNPFLLEKKYDLYYFSFKSKSLSKLDDNYIYEKESLEEDFIIIIYDIYNDRGESFYQLLDKKNLNDSGQQIKDKNKKNKNKKEEKKIEEKNQKNKKEEPKKPKLTDEEKKKQKLS